MNTIFTITNQKGGVGKTTTAFNLGAALLESGKRVLLIDNDPQGNLTASMGYTASEQTHTLANLLLSAIDYPEDLELHLPRCLLHTDGKPDLIPANRRLADAAARLQVMQLSQYSSTEETARTCETVMAQIVAVLRKQYDYIIIDCGLKHELLTVNALAASDYCIIPVQAHFLASEGIPEVLSLIQSVQKKFNQRLKIAGILLTMYQSRPQLCKSVRSSVTSMKKHLKKVFALALALCMVLSLSVFASAANTVDASGGTGTSNVTLSSTADGSLGGDPAATKMSVTVPTVLPIAVGTDGTVSTATDAKIVNNSFGAVKVSSVSIEAAQGWSLTAFGDKATLAGEKVNANKFGFAITLGEGSAKQTDAKNASAQTLLSEAAEGCYMTGVGDETANSIAVAYDAIVTPVSEAVTNTAIASVLFIIAWDAV